MWIMYFKVITYKLKLINGKNVITVKVVKYKIKLVQIAK